MVSTFHLFVLDKRACIFWGYTRWRIVEFGYLGDGCLFSCSSCSKICRVEQGLMWMVKSTGSRHMFGDKSFTYSFCQWKFFLLLVERCACLVVSVSDRYQFVEVVVGTFETAKLYLLT